MSLSIVQEANSSTSAAPLHSLSHECRLSPCSSDSCSLSTCDVLKNIGHRREYLAGDNIFWEDDKADQYFLVVSGVVRGFRLLSDGRRQIHRFMFAGDLVAHTNCSQYTYTAEAVTPVQVIAISRHQLDEMIDEIPCLRHMVTHSVLDELRDAQDQVVLLGKMSAKERVSHFLLGLSNHLGTRQDGAIEIPMTRSDIADHLGLTIETVSRVFGRLKREGTICLISANRVLVPDPARLAEDVYGSAA